MATRVRRLYLIGAASYRARRDVRAAAAEAADPHGWSPPLFTELLNEFASAGAHSLRNSPDTASAGA